MVLIKRVFYCLGPGNIIDSYQCWKRNERDPSEVSVTFSDQILDFCVDINAAAYFVATHKRSGCSTDGAFTMEHRPKPVRSGLKYHLGEIIYGLGLLRTALRFKADVALIDSGTAHYFVLTLFRLLGIRVVPILHNTLWPHGYPPRKLVPRLVLKLDSLLFWPRVPTAVIGVSPECERQVNQVRGKRHYPILQTRAQFEKEYFDRISPPPPHEKRPFQMMFIGRIDRIKGIFDILEIARSIENSNPGLVRWEICGQGRDFDEVTRRHKELMLEGIVNLRGWTSLDDLVNV
jgi:glycogen synthase